MQQPTILGREDEDQAIDDPEELLEIGVPTECAFAQHLTKRCVGLILDETLAELEQRRLDSLTQFVARGDPIGAPTFAPALQRAIRNRSVGLSEPALMDQQPKRREIREQTFRKYLGEVRFDPGWPRQTDVVPHETQRDAIAHQAPAGVFLGV